MAVTPSDYAKLMDFVTKGLPEDQRDVLLDTVWSIRKVLAVFMPELTVHPVEARKLYSQWDIVQSIRELGGQYYTDALHDLDDPFDEDIQPVDHSLLTDTKRSFYVAKPTGLRFLVEIDNSREISALFVWRAYTQADVPEPLYR